MSPAPAPLGGQLCTYGTQSDLRWWMEATAQWAEPKVYPQSGTYPGSIDALLSQPYVSMPETDGYSSVIFARYLEDKVAGGSPDIIRKTWEEYSADSSNGMTVAIDSVLGGYGNKSWATEFPNFAWNNYFMINGTYDIQVTNVYTNLATLPPPFTGLEWQLFRSWLREDRDKWQAGNAGSSSTRFVNFRQISSMGLCRADRL
jgi:hypothetical protein